MRFNFKLYFTIGYTPYERTFEQIEFDSIQTIIFDHLRADPTLKIEFFELPF